MTLLRTYSSCLDSLTITGPACFGSAAPHGNDYVLLPTYMVHFRRHAFTGVRATTAQTTPDRCMAQAFRLVVPAGLVPGLTNITSVAWDHGCPQPRFATGSRDGTIFVWTPSFQPEGTMLACKAPRSNQMAVTATSFSTTDN